MKKLEPYSPDFGKSSRESTPLCAVVVASFRPGLLIDLCIRSLLGQKGVTPEIIVVDSSGDGTATRLRAAFPTITVVELQVQTPQAAARNIGVARSQAQFIAFTDQDCVAPPDWLLRLIAWHQRGNYEAVGGAIGNGTPESAVGTASYLIEFNEFLPFGTPRLVEMIPHCNICFRREVFTSVGSFLEVPPGAEDLLYNFFVRQQGGQLLYDPNIVMTHNNRTDFLAFLRHQRLLGFGSAIARRLAKLKGHLLVRHPFLSYGLPFLRFVRTCGRLLRYNRAALGQYLQLLPLLVPGYLWWTFGFLAGLRSRAPAPRANLTLAATLQSSAGITAAQSGTSTS